MGNSAKQTLGLSSGNILGNSMASHWLFTFCTPSVPSPGKGLQISLGNHSQNLQHSLVPDASYSRILKAIPQTPKVPEGGLCSLQMWCCCRGTTELPGHARSPQLWLCLCQPLFTMKNQGLRTWFQANVPLFPAFLKARFLPRWSQTCLNYCQSEMQMSIMLFIGLSHPQLHLFLEQRKQWGRNGAALR